MPKVKEVPMKVFPVCVIRKCIYIKDGFCNNTKDSKNTPCLGRHKEWKKYQQ